MAMVATGEKWRELLVHMLGAGSHVPKKSHGFRNRFCAGIGSSDHNTMLEMERSGLVKAGQVINEGRDQMFYATVAGCQAMRLGKAATKRAMDK